MYSNKLICEILLYINNNIQNKITIQKLENNFFYNKYYIMKLFKKEIGLTIIEYINSIRIYNAILQIKNSSVSFTYIALENGFYSLEYFSEIFKKIAKLPPRKYKDYFSHKKNISTKEINLINDSIIKLYETSNIKDKYLSRQKPTIIKAKKLSIFR